MRGGYCHSTRKQRRVPHQHTVQLGCSNRSHPICSLLRTGDEPNACPSTLLAGNITMIPHFSLIRKHVGLCSVLSSRPGLHRQDLFF